MTHFQKSSTGSQKPSNHCEITAEFPQIKAPASDTVTLGFKKAFFWSVFKIKLESSVPGEIWFHPQLSSDRTQLPCVQDTAVYFGFYLRHEMLYSFCWYLNKTVWHLWCLCVLSFWQADYGCYLWCVGNLWDQRRQWWESNPLWHTRDGKYPTTTDGAIIMTISTW